MVLLMRSLGSTAPPHWNRRAGGSPVEILGDHEDLEFRDTDVYGCQLHAPLLEVDLAI